MSFNLQCVNSSVVYHHFYLSGHKVFQHIGFGIKVAWAFAVPMCQQPAAYGLGLFANKLRQLAQGVGAVVCNGHGHLCFGPHGYGILHGFMWWGCQ